MTRTHLSGFALLALAGAALAQPKPAQVPLLSQSAPPPNPNVMITLDDSGSMGGQSVPEGTFTVNGQVVSFPANNWVLVTPLDPSINAISPANRRFLPQLSSSNNSNVFDISLFAAQTFSSSVNRIYYDPTVRYLPWFRPDATRMAPASPAAPLWDPMIPGFGAYNTTQANTTIRTRWCATITNCGDNLDRRWWAGIYTVLKPGSDPNNLNNYAVYNINGSTVLWGGKSVTLPYSLPIKPPGRLDCVGSAARCTQAEERQNFANWFQYYRSRMLLAKGALVEVVINSQSSAPRFGFGSINSPMMTVDGDSTRVVRVPTREYALAHRTTLITDIQSMKAGGGTPLRPAVMAVGDYFSRSGSTGNPWASDPGRSGSPVLACRRSYHILMTDGYYNDATNDAGNVDNTIGPTHALGIPDLTPVPPNHYTPARPFSDNYSSTLADVAMQYYVNDLQPSLDNKVQPVTGELSDPAYWQHLSQFSVGLGVSGTLAASTPAERIATLAAIRSGSLAWPNPAIGNPQKIDDMFHAAVSTRGDYFQANNASEMTTALVSAVGRASAAGRAEAGVSLSSNAFVADSLLFVPSYRSGQWFGDVQAYEIDDATHDVRVDAGGNKVVRWTASAKRPDADERNLYTWGVSPAGGVAFTNKAMDAATKNLISTTATGRAELINYLRGDASKEGDGSDPAKPYRLRGDLGKLPDFLNSPPILVRNRSAGAYDLLPLDGPTYNAYLTAKQNRSKGALFIGGNGGMLHAFDAGSGEEVFGFLPRTTLPGLIDLSKQNYGTATTPHRLFVDGPLSEHDALIARSSSPAAWRNVLLSSLGGGGKALFALEAGRGDPTALDASSVMWEVADSAMGYMLADARVGKLKGAGLGEGWKVFVGNGVYSSDGSATLLVVNLATGAVEKKITVDSSGGNGLMGVRLVLNDKQEVYAAYAGDLKGNLWRFDFESATDVAKWQVGFKGKPLFRAVTGAGLTPQPITAPPIYGAHPEGGTVVVAGTGRLIDVGDTTDTQLQSVFGVRDPTLTNESSANADSPFLAYLSSGNGKIELQVQTITPSSVAGYFDITGNAVDWKTKKGWYMDLGGLDSGLDNGTRVIVSPKRVLSYTYIDAVVPGAAPQACESSSGKGYGFIVQLLSGARPATPIFDTNGDNKVDSSDTAAAAGFVSGGDGRDGVQAATGDILGSGSDDGGEVRQQSCLPDESKPPFCPVPNTCLVVIHTAGEAIKQCLPFTPTARDRVWQQLMTPPTPEKNVD
ncbi:MAG: hypothetical protein LCH73_01750 [Proteobacteria bacterium]|nr:hypothetical protein [Pseudomonadota bacterium]